MNSPPLPRVQQAFARYLRSRDEAVAEMILGDGKADARERLDLYAGAYVTRLIEVLENHYAGLWGLVGDEQFWRLCREYIQAHPSTFTSVRHFGHRMADFLSKTEPYSAYPRLAEMAAFEWAQGQVFDAPDSRPLGEADLLQVPPEQWGEMRFTLAPSMRVLDLRWNVPQQWQALDHGEEPPEATCSEVPIPWLIWRQALDPCWRPLEVDEAWALEQAVAGEKFAALCAGLLEWVDARNAPLRVAGFLKSWLDHQLITAIRC